MFTGDQIRLEVEGPGLEPGTPWVYAGVPSGNFAREPDAQPQDSVLGTGLGGWGSVLECPVALTHWNEEALLQWSWGLYTDDW